MNEAQPIQSTVPETRRENGFYAVTHAPSLRMTGVQCEVCHGPARDHAETQQKFKDNVKNWMEAKAFQALVDHGEKVKPSAMIEESTCKQCHTPENGGDFVYAKKRHMVSH